MVNISVGLCSHLYICASVLYTVRCLVKEISTSPAACTAQHSTAQHAQHSTAQVVRYTESQDPLLCITSTQNLHVCSCSHTLDVLPSLLYSQEPNEEAARSPAPCTQQVAHNEISIAVKCVCVCAFTFPVFPDLNTVKSLIRKATTFWSMHATLGTSSSELITAVPCIAADF